MRRDEDLIAPAAFSAGGTIVALSTARGLGAVAVVRLSGPDAWTVGRTMVAGRKKFDRLPEREMALFDLVDSSGERLDRALAVKFKGPRSYTGEDVVEFHCHGGLAVTSGVIDAARAGGVRSAMAGEFTRRAFLNGRMDLAQAEAVDSLVNARTAEGRRASLAGMNGELGEEIQRMRASLLDLLAGLEYRIDFPDEATQETSAAGLDSLLQSCTITLDSLLAGADRALLQARGVVAVIAGEPNVGKSSLFNCLLGEERSIVTASPGTTRDAIERELVIGGHLVRLVDTAGLRQSCDEAECKGVEYSGKYIASSDLVLFVHQAGNDLDRAEKAFLAKYKTGRLIRVANKADLYPEGVPDGFVGVSAKTGEGIEELKRAIAAVMEDGAVMAGSAKVTSLRQKKLLEESRELLGAINLSAPPEMIASDLSEVCTRLGEITGQIAGEDVLEAIFSRFCLGK